MIVRRVSCWFTALVALATIWVAGAVASEPPAVEEDSPKQEALKWLDQFRQEQVLFHDKDLLRVRQELAAGDAELARRWLEKTTPIREALDSPEWKDTQKWLREFLRVQAIYTDQQISEFRDKVEAAAKESPEKFKEILAEIEARRARLKAGSANDARVREERNAVVRAYQQDAVAQREADRRARQSPKPPSVPGQPVPRREYYRPLPIVDSLDAARWTIMREFWGPCRRR